MRIQFRQVLGAALAAGLIGSATAAGPARPAATTAVTGGASASTAVQPVGHYHSGGYREYKDFSFSLGRYPRFRYRHYKSYRRRHYGHYGRRSWRHRYYRRHRGHHILRGVLRSLPYFLAR